MRLSLENGKKIAKVYSLGSLKRILPIKGGLSNFNFEILTTQGTFIARCSSFDIDGKRKERLNMQIDALLHIHRKGFEFEVPLPLKSVSGGYVRKISGAYFWVYRKIEGEVYADLEKVDIKKVAELMAKYHIAIKGFPMEKDRFNEYDCLKKDLKKIKGQSPKNELDILVNENRSLLERAAQRIMNINFGPERILTHSDWYVGNLIFRDEKLVGIIDFDNFEIAPAVKDIACAIQLYCMKNEQWDKKKVDVFMHEYSKYNTIAKFDKYHVKDHIIRESLFTAMFVYFRNKKADMKKRLFMVRWSIESIKNLLKDVEAGRYL
ncbi:MAG: phosphotransferase [Nanoarchaeota archaeon]